MADIFISYARAERAEAEAVKARLEAEGLSVFLDVDGLDGGDVFSEKLDREVKNAGIVLGLWSPHALARPWVQIECDIGKRRGVLIPVAIKPFRDMDVPAPFWNIQFVDLTEALHNAADPNWAKLQRSIARTLNRPEIAPKPATTSKAANDLPDWARARTGGSWDAKDGKKNGGGVAGWIIGGVLFALVGGGGAFLYFDPMRLGLLDQITGRVNRTAAAEPGPSTQTPAVITPTPAPAVAGPDPAAAKVVGRWAPAGLACEDAITIASSGRKLQIASGGSTSTETIGGVEPDGTLRTQDASGGSFFYQVSESGMAMTLHSAGGAAASFTKCGS